MQKQGAIEVTPFLQKNPKPYSMIPERENHYCLHLGKQWVVKANHISGVSMIHMANCLSLLVQCR